MLIERIEKVFDLFGILQEERKPFLRQQLNIKDYEEFENDDIKVSEFANYFNINKQWLYGNSNELFKKEQGFYKRHEAFCQTIIEKSPNKLYIISQREPNKSKDEITDDNQFFIIAEYIKKIFNGKKIHVYEVFNTSGCRWGYWRCRWELKKTLLCFKSHFFINNIYGIVNENIIGLYYKFIQGEEKFETLLGDMSLWYPEDYIEFKSQNVNAKEEDELKEILELEDMEKKENQFLKKELELVYKFKSYLIEVYGYESENIKLGYRYNDFYYDLVILKNNKPFIGFELKRNIKNIQSLNKKEELLNKYYNFEYFVFVALYEDEWYMECYKDNELVINIPIFKKYEEKFIIEKTYKFLYANGKKSRASVIKILREYLILYIDRYRENSLGSYLRIFSKDFVDQLIIYRLLSFIQIKNNKKIIEIFFELAEEKNIFKFKDEFLEFLNILVGKKFFSIMGLQPDFVKLNLEGCFLKDENDYSYLIKHILEQCNHSNEFNNLLYFDLPDIDIENINLLNYNQSILITKHSFFRGIKNNKEYESIVKKIKLIINLSDTIFDNTMTSYSFVVLGENSDDICIINADFEKLFKYADNIKNYLEKNQKIEENNDIFYLTNEEFQNTEIGLIGIYNILKKLKNSSNEKYKLLNIVNVFNGRKCKRSEEIKNSIIRYKNIKYNKIFELEYVDDECYKKSIKTKENDFIISKIGEYKCVKITEKYENCIVDDNLFILRVKDNDNLKLLEEFLFSDLAKYIFTNLKVGNTIRILNKKYLEEIYIPKDINSINIEYSIKKDNLFFNICSDDSFMNFIGVENEILNFTTISGYLTNSDIKKISLEDANFQRDKYKYHLENLKDFLQTKNTTYKFLPFLTLGIENFDEFESDEFFIEGIKLRKICFKQNDFRNIKIIDGNHRWNAIKDSLYSLDDNFKIGVVFIILGNKAYAPVFYTLNSKAKPLISSDYLNLMEQEEDILNELNTLGMNSPKLYFEIRDYFYKKNIFLYSEFKNQNKKEKYSKIDEKILELVDFIEKNKLQKFINYFKVFFKTINNFNDYKISFEIIKSIIKFYNDKIFLNEYKKFKYFLIKEFNDFYQYLKETKLLEKLNELDLYPIFEIYKKTYVPKSRKIYLSMPYHIHEDVIYFVSKDVVNEVSKNIGEKIELIRTDKRKLGVHGQIESKIYNEIEECDLMIADITGNNPNVYAEVGYKMAIDKSNGIKEPQIIFIKNTRGYYEKVYYNEKAYESGIEQGYKKLDEIKIEEQIRRNKVSKTAFNFAHIDQIEFYDVEYLQRELENMLLKYYNYYKIKK